MSSLKEKLDEKLKQAMKSRNEIEVSTIRMLRAAIKNREIEIRKPIDDAGVVSLVQKMVRQHEEAIEQFKKGNRHDLVEKELKEVSVLKPLLPVQLPLPEIEKAVQMAISKMGAQSLKQMGEVMKAVGGELAGRADMKEVSRIVREKLSK